jgi:hypothetical protein
MQVSAKDLKPGQVIRMTQALFDTMVENRQSVGGIYVGGFYKVQPSSGYDPADLLRLFSQRKNLDVYSVGYMRKSWTTPIEVVDWDSPEIQNDPRNLAHFMPTVRPFATVGTDPEIFVVHGQKRKTIYPAWNFLPPKASPVFIGSSDSTSRVYKDGFAAEGAIAAGSCQGYLMDRVREFLRQVLREARAKDETAELTLTTGFAVPRRIMYSADPDDIALGCAPSLNAYNDSPTLPLDSREANVRFAGGHIHLGLNKPKSWVAAVKGADIIAGVTSVAMFEGLEHPARREYYGRAGEYRLPKHGLEYRVLSNAWLGDPRIAHLCFNLVRSGVRVGIAGYEDKLGLREEEARSIINNNDVKAARKWLEPSISMLYTLLLQDGISTTRYEDGGGVHHTRVENEKYFRRVCLEGVLSVFPNYTDIPRNWKFSGTWENHTDRSRKTWGLFTGRP